MLFDTPDFVTEFMPSSYNLYCPGAEHPWFGEPSFTPEEYNLRTRLAEDFVARKFTGFLHDWSAVCACECDKL